MFGWFKKKAINTKDSAKNFGKSVVGWDEARSGGSYILEMLKRLNPKYVSANARKETFSEAQSRLNVQDHDLRIIYKQLALSFYVSLFFAIVCFGILLHVLFNVRNILSSLSVLAIFILCLSNMFRFSFRSFQIKHKKLCPFQDWWNRSSEWIPNIIKPPF